MKYGETAESKFRSRFEDSVPIDAEYTFIAQGGCDNCQQTFVMAGRGGLEPGYDEEGEMWEEWFMPSFLHPPPHMIEIPPKSPEKIKKELVDAFGLFWHHQGACAGRLRVALELLMDHLHVPRRGKTKKDKFRFLSLHERIERYQKKKPDIGKRLMALKWLGNTASHEQKVEKADLLDAFAVLEHSLQEILEGRTENIDVISKELTKKHRKRRR